MADEIPKGAIGVTFRARWIGKDEEVLPIAGASAQSIVLKAPNGKVKTFPAVYPAGEDGTEGQQEYKTLAATDLDVAGDWEGEGNVTIPGVYTGPSLKFFFTVAETNS